MAACLFGVQEVGIVFERVGPFLKFGADFFAPICYKHNAARHIVRAHRMLTGFAQFLLHLLDDGARRCPRRTKICAMRG